MKTFTSTILLLTIALTAADELSDCKCGSGYEANKRDDGTVECAGIFVRHATPCNLPEYPICECSEGVDGILYDKTGIWCTESDEGKEKKRWACENKEAWDKFFEEHPDLVPKPEN